MTILTISTIIPDEDGLDILTHQASALSVGTVLSAAMDDNGRSPWVWVRLPSGDLFLGTFPKGDTYFELETDAAWPGEREIQWCESCGGSPVIVRSKDAGLCCGCAARTIDQLSEEVARA